MECIFYSMKKKRGDLECWCWFTGSWEAIAANSSVKRSNYTRLRPVKQKISLLTNIFLNTYMYHGMTIPLIWKVECMSYMNARMNWWSFGLLFSVCCWHRENGAVLVVSFAIFIYTRPDFRDLLRSIRSVQNYNRFLVYLTIYTCRSIEIWF